MTCEFSPRLRLCVLFALSFLVGLGFAFPLLVFALPRPDHLEALSPVPPQIQRKLVISRSCCYGLVLSIRLRQLQADLRFSSRTSYSVVIFQELETVGASPLSRRTPTITRTVPTRRQFVAAMHASNHADGVAITRFLRCHVRQRVQGQCGFSQVTSDPRCNARQRTQDGGWRTRPDQSVRIVFKFDFGGQFRRTRTVLRPTSSAAPTHASSAKTSIRLGEQFRRTRTVLRPTSSAAPTHASSVNPILFLIVSCTS